MIYLVSQARSRGASRSTRSRITSHAFRNVRGVGSRRTDERLAGRDRYEGRRVRAALGHHLRSQRERRGELDLPNPGWAGGGLGRDRYCRVRRGGPHDHAPAQDLARAGRARLGTVSAREAGGGGKFAEKKSFLSVREGGVGRGRGVPG